MTAELAAMQRCKRNACSPGEMFVPLPCNALHTWSVQVAKLSLWLMDHLQNREFSRICGIYFNRIPLVTSPNIYHANALQMDWPEGMNYIFGNPPYTGGRKKNERQKEEMSRLGVKSIGLADYIAAWFIIASTYMTNSKHTKTAFVTTNSINQGEQVSIVWKPLFDAGIHINFAIPSFHWSNEAKNKAAVTVSIVGFSLFETQPNINAYLKEAPDLWIRTISKSLCNVPKMSVGNRPKDWENYIFTENEENAFLECMSDEEKAKVKKYLHPLMSGEDLLQGKHRSVFYLAECPDDKLASMPQCRKRVDAVSIARHKCKNISMRRLENLPKEFEVT
ncbi:MAG: hypothetical protein LBU24_00900, partial [Methanocalculaceae archaeon]|nr:hypothetical protein [Methanocalculaceae archaeon]